MMLGLRDRWYPEKILKNAKLDLVNIKMIRCMRGLDVCMYRITSYESMVDFA